MGISHLPKSHILCRRLEYLNKSNQNLVHYLSCQAVRRTAYLNFCGSRMLKGLGTMALALASKVQALALRFWPWLHHWSAPQWLIPPVEQTSVMPITVTCLSHKPGHCSQCSADEASVLLLQLFWTVFLCSRDELPLALSEDRIRRCGTSSWVSPQGHRSKSATHHFLLQALQCPSSVRKLFSRGHCCRGRSTPGCQTVESHTSWELTTWADFQLCLHRLLMSA